MADNGSILVTGAAGQLGAVGRTVTGLLLDRGLPARAMVRREDDRAAGLRAAGAEVVIRRGRTRFQFQARLERDVALDPGVR
jgi:NAD(P)H dehydrogenase (quinone)